MRVVAAFLLMTLSYGGWAQTESPAELERVVESNAHDTTKFWACLDLHNHYFKNNPEKSLAYAGVSWQIAQKGGRADLQNKAAQMLARCFRKQRNYKHVLHYDSLALQFAMQLKNKDQLFAAKLMLSKDFLDANDYGKAYTWLKQTESLANESRKPAQQAATFQVLGYYFSMRENHKAAISYFTKAIAAYTSLAEEYKIVETKMFLVESMLKIGRTKHAASHLFDAIETFKKNGNESRLAYCFKMLGQVFMMNGDMQRGASYLLQAKSLFHQTNNFVEEGLTLPDLAREALHRKDHSLAKRYLTEADSLFTATSYDLGRLMVHTLWGQYHSVTGNWPEADKNFGQSHRLLQTVHYPDAKLENEKQWAVHRYRQNRMKEADSLTYSYASYLAASKAPETIAMDLEMLKKRSTGADSSVHRLLHVLYTPGGVEKIKSVLKENSLTALLNIDSLYQLNPYSLAPASFDSAMTATFNQQFLELETRYRTRQIADSLKQQTQARLLVEQASRQKTYLLIGILVFCALLAGISWLQYRNRKRAEKDKQRIELLQHEIHHRVKNNLAVINRLVDVTGKNTLPESHSLAALKTRIKSIELLHRHLYSQEARTGSISLQAYFDDLSAAIASTFASAKDISIQVHAPAEVESTVAEKLGLIITELVTNSFKYAFQSKQAGTITIVANKNEKELKLVVTDDGIGMSAETTKTSYGMKLIKGLSHELKGVFSFQNNNGTQFQLSLPV